MSTDRRIGKRVRNERRLGGASGKLDDLFRLFYDAKVAEGISEGTLRMYRENYSLFTDFLEVREVERDISQINSDLCRAYQTWLLSEKIRFEGHRFKSEKEMTVGVSPVTVNTRTKSLRTMFRFLHLEGLIPDNPWTSVKKVIEPEKEIKIMSREQLGALLKVPDQRTYAGFRDYVIMTLLVDAFLRINEALTLRKENIDFDLGMITIEATIAKSRKQRSVPVSKQTLRLLKELIDECEDFGSEYVFLTNYGEPVTDDHFRNRLKEHVKKAGFSLRVHPHLFRHTSATLFLEDGGDIRHLAKILGHADLRMVVKYTHLSNKALKAEHERYSPLNSVIGKLSRERKIKR